MDSGVSCTGLRSSRAVRDSALLLATAIIALTVILSDSVIRCFLQFWLASGEFLQSLWTTFLQRVGDDDYVLSVYGSMVLIIGLYWAVGMIYVVMDYFNWPQWIRKYKVQQGTNEPVETKRLLNTVGQVLFNQIFVTFPLTWCYFWIKPSCADPIHQLPSFSRAITDLLTFVAIEEVGFYYSHRLLHHPWIYKHIHKKHHQWTSPIAITAIYCHPVEHAMSNMLPIIAGPYIMSSHISVSWLWYSMAIITTLNDHSGYHIPGFRSPEAHDFHHLKFTECYGVLGFLDYLHGTDKVFRSGPHYRRHFMSWTMKPVRVQYPDEPNSGKNR